jgi:multidrug transporter EmrE-like cation transporter
MAWVALVAAGLFETGFAVCLKLSNAVSVTKLVSIALILSGVVGLNLSGATP